MGLMRGGIAIGLVVVLIGAGGPTRAEAMAGPDPVVQEWPSWPYPTACGSLPFEPVAAFSSPTGAENGSRPSEVALREYLRETESYAYPTVPLYDWRLLAETDTRAEFASGQLSAPGGPSVVSVSLKDGVWKYSGSSSGCRPTSIVDGTAAITWRLDADQKALRRGTKKIEIDLGPGPCSGGRSQNARAMKPLFWQSGRRLLMVMRLRPLPPGRYTCQGVINPPLTIHLPKRLGKRKLFDGGTYPPVDVVEIWRETAR